MKNRTFFATLFLFLLAMNSVIAALSLSTLRDATVQAKEQCLGSQYLIAASLYRDMAALADRGIEPGPELEELVQPYLYLTGNRQASLAIYEEDNLLHTTGLLSGTFPVPTRSSGETRSISLDREADRYLCSVSGALPEPFGRYLVFYQTDVTEHITAWRHRSNTMFLAGGIVSLALALFLLLLLNRLFRPLLQVTALSRRIAGGDYTVRLPQKGRDEVAQMARSFNHMAGEVEDKVTQLAAAAENRQRFVDNFSHELRTPLTNIHGYAEYLQRAALSEEDARYALECILSESYRMQDMASQLLELSGLRTGEIRMEPVSLPGLLDSLKATVAQKLLDKSLLFSVDSQVKTLTGDETLLHILLINLVDNAVKASAPGAVICLETFYQDDCPVITVTDQGKGMEQSELTRITEPFYRVDKARNRRDGGAGLGLAICHQIVRRHGAELSFHSSLGKGTTAMVSFTTP